MFEGFSAEILPAEPLARPNDRTGQTGPDLALPAGTLVFSADNHIEVGEDIWYPAFPAKLKDRAPRVWQEDGINHIGVGGTSMLPPPYVSVLEPYGRVPGFNSQHLDARLRDLDVEGVDQELAFPNTLLMLLHYPDFEVRELSFRIYNEYIASLQERSGGRFWGVGLINWWDDDGARRTLDELKALGVRTFLMPLNPGADRAGDKIDYASARMAYLWDAVEASGLAVSHHVGESFNSPCEYNNILISYVHSVAPFRDMFARYIFGGILDRHPSLRIGWFEGGINWLPSAMQDVEHAHASFWHMRNLELRHAPDHYWREHMCASFVVDPLGLEMLDRVGVERVLWSSDYPHIEGAFGYGRSSLNHAAKAVGAANAAAVVGGNARRFLGLPERAPARA